MHGNAGNIEFPSEFVKRMIMSKAIGAAASCVRPRSCSYLRHLERCRATRTRFTIPVGLSPEISFCWVLMSYKFDTNRRKLIPKHEHEHEHHSKSSKPTSEECNKYTN